jgi:molybdopterin-containing oxidoreductase family iron-sulfur binding subunit
VLADASSSPTRQILRDVLLRVWPEASWHEWEPVSRDAERDGAFLAFGAGFRVLPRLDQAEVIVSLDADFLVEHPEAVRLAREFASRRRATDGTMNRLHVVESAYSLTGAAADHRYAVAPSEVPAVAARLAAAVLGGLDGSLDPALAPLAPVLARFAALPAGAPFVGGVARDLLHSRGRCLVLAGLSQPAEVHALVHVMNLALGNLDRTVACIAPADAREFSPERAGGRRGHPDSLRDLVEKMHDGAADTLIILGGNPVFDAPADLAFVEALHSVPFVARLGLYEDETTDACFAAAESAWHLPQAHYLESWGDARAWDGTYGVVQPLIAPLYDGRTASEVLAVILGEAGPGGYELVRRTAARLLGAAGASDPAFEPRWRELLEDGLLEGSAGAPDRAEIRTPELIAALNAFQPGGGPAGRPEKIEGRGATGETGEATTRQATGSGAFEIVFRPDPKLWDGRFANNAWLQETPDPLTKLTWDNAACLAPADAASLGIGSDDLVVVSLSGRELRLPAYIVPGIAAGTVALHLGYGRSAPGKVARGAGFNVYPLRASAGLWSAGGATLRRAGGSHPLATTQDHHIIDKIGVRGEAERVPVLVREATLGEYREHPEFAQHAVHHPPLVSLWQEHEYKGHRWGMAIDLSACNGCSACVVACTAENNIPVVGKQRVLQGREMHWIRIDRYFRGEAGAPEVAFQPTACVHCENAPCEQVCPVAATVHDREGLNVMVYNRCIGTRYCSNNCPYKVRRFNFFNYRKDYSATEKMAMNPEVTVRSRGVMEKCNYCMQRIEAARIAAKNERREVRDGEIAPACAQTCPTQAIVFGDLNDPKSRVARLRADPRSYATLAELNVKPRTQYLAKLRNQAGAEGDGAPAGANPQGAAPSDAKPASEPGHGGRHEG